MRLCESRLFRTQCGSTAYSDNFTGLTQALIDSGLGPTFLLECDTRGIDSVTAPPQLLASLEAVLITALGDGAVSAARARARRTDLPVKHPPRDDEPARREEMLECFRKDIRARSNTASQDARWK